MMKVKKIQVLRREKMMMSKNLSRKMMKRRS